MTEIQSSCHVKSSLAIPRGRYIPPKTASEMGATEQASVYWPSWKEPLPKSPHRYDPEIRKRLIAGRASFSELLRNGREFMATQPISDWLKVEKSARLLHAIFPNYPVLYPCRPTPPIEQWPLLDKSRRSLCRRSLVTNRGAVEFGLVTTLSSTEARLQSSQAILSCTALAAEIWQGRPCTQPSVTPIWMVVYILLLPDAWPPTAGELGCAPSSLSTRNSVSGIANSVKLQSKQTTSFGNTHTMGLSRP
jgi:hypothetical protein